MPEKIIIAMSGGVDSSVAAALALQAGFEVEGATLRLGNPGDDAAVAAAAEVAAKLGIVHHVLERGDAFACRVIEPSAREYAAGRTPNPCCVCNFTLKFAELIDFAAVRGAGRVWTGHYVRIDADGIRRGVDRAKDQSYFLCRLTPKQLGKIGFPLGEYNKPAVRKIAAELNLPVAARPDSQDVCFAAPGENCAEILHRRAGLPAKPGRFIYKGREVGRHSGMHRYTIGQRQGLGVALGVPAYVAAIDPKSGDITLATDQKMLECTRFTVADLNWQSAPPAPGDATLAVQVRYRSPAAPCRIAYRADGTVEVELDRAIRAVTPGQAGVFYRGDRLLGGGVIERGSTC